MKVILDIDEFNSEDEIRMSIKTICKLSNHDIDITI